MMVMILLSITSHTHKHNNNTANIITITICLVCTCFKIIPALTTADMEWNRHGKSCYMCELKVCGPRVEYDGGSIKLLLENNKWRECPNSRGHSRSA